MNTLYDINLETDFLNNSLTLLFYLKDVDEFFIFGKHLDENLILIILIEITPVN